MSFNPILRTERVGEMFGVQGRFTGVTRRADERTPDTFCRQRFIASRKVDGALLGLKPGLSSVSVEIRFDDDCRNGHNTFSITGEVRTHSLGESWGGCVHDEIAKAFPEFAPLIQWHLVSADGPMHYLANALYLAGDRDSSGRREGEPCAWVDIVRFGTSPIAHEIKSEKFAAWLRERAALGVAPEIVAVPYKKTDRYEFGPKYTFAGYLDKPEWHYCPFDSEREAREWALALTLPNVQFARVPTLYSKGKARELDAARRVAIWPDATDEQLCAPKEELKAALEARLPGLMAEFRAMIDASGFAWSARDLEQGECN